MQTHLNAPELDLLTLYGSRAPSPCNVRPWEFHRDGDELELVADPGRAPAQGEAALREVILSCGAALLNMRVALRHFGRRDDVDLLPEPRKPSVIARIRAGRPVHESPRDREMFYAIERRHTIHGALGGTVTSALVTQCRIEAQVYGAWLHVITSATDREAIADLIFEAHVAAASAGDAPACDDWHGTTLTEASAVRRMVRHAPVLMLLGTYGDDAAHWIAAGEALEAILLHAAAHETYAAFANQPLRIPQLRPWVTAVAGHRGSPHVLFGLGS